MFSYHLTETPLLPCGQSIFFPFIQGKVAGLIHSESLVIMTLGTPILSLARMQVGKVAFFAYWDSEQALDHFLDQHPFGQVLNQGWHVRLKLLYQWGAMKELQDLKVYSEELNDDQPIVSVTLARLKLSQTLRFTHWGKPVESFVRDHPGKVLALAAYRPLNTFSTFSIWKTQNDMKDMVFGKQHKDKNTHARAMQERNRKDFHHEFTTLRFRALSEYGTWQGQQNIVPKL